MRREFRKLLVAALVAVPVALASSPGVARAGISTEGKLASKPATAYYENQGDQLVLNVLFLARGSSGGGSSTSDESQATPPGKRGPKSPGDPVMLYGQDEYGQIQAGLITPEEAISGCGGAQVAGGNAGWGALALVGLFLALRRRK